MDIVIDSHYHAVVVEYYYFLLVAMHINKCPNNKN